MINDITFCLDRGRCELGSSCRRAQWPKDDRTYSFSGFYRRDDRCEYFEFADVLIFN